MPDNNDTEIIDFGLLGALIRHKRQQAGFKRAEDLATAITELVGYPVSKEPLYKVESGRQKPSLELYVSIMRALEPEGDYTFDGLVDMALPNSWSSSLEEIDYERYSELYPSNSYDTMMDREAAKPKKGALA